MKLNLGQIITCFLPDTRGVRLSRYGAGNLKIGMADQGVYTYSKLPGLPENPALGLHVADLGRGTCPGASEECQAICYARRPVEEGDVVYEMWRRNTEAGAEVPPIPDDCKILRMHISGDFDSVEYIRAIAHRLIERPDVKMFAYTRSWRVPSLLHALEELRKLPNVQVLASMDKSIAEVPPKGWRHAWIDGDPRAGKVYKLAPHGETGTYDHHNARTTLGTMTYLCPEQTKRVKNCAECGYCIDGTKNDVTFLEH